MQTNTPPRAEFLPIDKLRPFENHPFRVKDDAEMDQLVFSVLTQGLLTPIVVRETETAEYEVISGHRRLRACQKAGIETVPALIYSMDRDAAIIALVDSNLHREHLLPSEKAFAYRMKMEAMSHQGQRSDLTSSQVATKLDSASSIGKSQGESRDQVFRYIRLTYLIPEILQMVDEKKIALTPAVELSYLTESQQRDLLETMESEDCTPSLSQSQQLKKQKPQMSEPVCLPAEARSPRKREHDVPKPKNPIILQASILTRKVEGKSSKKFGFWCLQKTEFWREPQSEPQANLRVQKIPRKVRKTPDFLSKSGVFMVAEAGLEPTTSGL